MIYWRLGFPGWRFAATLGMPIKVKILIHRDDEAGVYCAYAAPIGLAVESETLDGLLEEIHSAVPVLLELNHSPVKEPKADIRFRSSFAAA